MSEIKQDFEEKREIPNSLISRKVLITTGSFVNVMKFNVLKPLNIKTYKKTVALLKISEYETNRLSSMPSIIYRGENENSPQEQIRAYILPPIKYPDGNYYLKIGYYGKDFEIDKLQDMKEWYLSSGDQELVKLGSKLLTEMLPGLKYESITSDTCVMCYTPTELPYIDQITPTIAIAVAGNGKGAKFSDEVGRIAANLCITGIWNTDLPRTCFKVDFL